MSRRITGTIPHSHIGKTRPRTPLNAIAAVGLRGRIPFIFSEGTKASMIPERSVPMNMKGTPSNRMLKNEIEKSCKLNVNQFITCHAEPHGMDAARTRDRCRKRNGGTGLNSVSRDQALPPTALLDERRGVLENVST